MSDGGVRYGMNMSSHRGNPGSSSAKNSNRNASLIYIYQEMEKRSRERKIESVNNNSRNSQKKNNGSSGNRKVSISNIPQVETVRSSGSIGSGSDDNNERRQQRASRRSNRNHYRGRNRSGKPVNLLPEIDGGVRGIGVANGDATPQELYAIGAVFDHIYRGGSPLNCISVFRKEVNRSSPAKMYGCGGLGCGLNGEDEKSHGDDDDTLPTMDFTFTRSASMDDDFDNLLDLYTLDGTYDRSFRTRSYRSRSFRSRDSLSQSSLEGDRAKFVRQARNKPASDQPWDEENDEDTNAGRIGGPSPPQHRSRKGSGYRNDRADRARSGKRGTPPLGASLIDDDAPLRTVEEDDERMRGDDSVDSDDTRERLKTWSEVLAAVARDGATACSGGDGNPASNARAELTSLVHTLRKTVAENMPEDTRASLARAFDTNLSSFLRSYDRHDAEDYYHGTDAGHGTNEAPLNSLARAMKNIATKEPTRTYAVSEQDQVAGRKSNSAGLTVTISPPVLDGELSATVSDSVEVTIESSIDAPQFNRRMRSSGGIAGYLINPSKRTGSNVGASSTASVGGASRSHRGGDVSSVATPVRSTTTTGVPTSIRLPPSEAATKAAVLQELFVSPPRVRSSASTASSTRRSFFRRRDPTTADASTTATVVSSSSPRRNLPPVPPSRSTTTRSYASGSAGKLNQSSDTIRTENSIIFDVNTDGGLATDNTTVATPPRSAPDAASTKSSPSTGISLKKRFSFRRKRTGGSNAGSPRSVTDTSSIFQTHADNLGSSAGNENFIVAVIDESKDGVENRTTDGVLDGESDRGMLCEEMSV